MTSDEENTSSMIGASLMSHAVHVWFHIVMGNVLEVGADVRLHDAIVCLRLLDAEHIAMWETAMQPYLLHYEASSSLHFIKVPLDSQLDAFCTGALGQTLRMLEGVVHCVGSGAWRLETQLKELFPLASFQRHREAPCLLAGLSVFERPLFRFVADSNSWDMGAADSIDIATDPADLPTEPFLLVTMKSGCSFFKVCNDNGNNSISRVGGSSLGGCSFNALMSALVPVGEEAIDSHFPPGELGESLDLTVGDIYGGEDVPASLNLPSHVIASVFGKAQKHPQTAATSRSIYNLLAINTAQLAFLHASLCGCTKIVFAFIQGREVQYRMNKFLQFWSKGGIDTIFCGHAEVLASAGTIVLPGDYTTYEENRFDETCTSLQLSVDDQQE